VLTYSDLEYSQFDATYNHETERWTNMNVRHEAVRFSLSELARENITPDIDLDAPTALLESELVDMVSMYNGKEAADEARRLFILESRA
jgi:hypothetical protein